MSVNRGKSFVSAVLLLSAFALLLLLPEVAAAGVKDALRLCAQVLLPSLFPFFVCSDLLFLLGFSARLCARFGAAVSRVLLIPGAAGSAFVLGLLGGYPAGAQAVALLYEQGELSAPEAERALAVCNQAGPSFIFGVLGGAVFRSARVGAFLYGIQVLSAVLVCRLTGEKQPVQTAQKQPSAPPENFSAAFSEAVRRAGMNALQVCMFVTVFSVLSRFLLLAIGARLPDAAQTLLRGLLELSSGCAALAQSSLAPTWKLCFASGFLAFGGLSVLAQSRAAVAEAGLDGKKLLPCKLLQASIACALTLLLSRLLPVQRWCVPAAAVSVGFQLPASCTLLVCSICLLTFYKIYHSFSGAHRV